MSANKNAVKAAKELVLSKVSTAREVYDELLGEIQELRNDLDESRKDFEDADTEFDSLEEVITEIGDTIDRAESLAC